MNLFMLYGIMAQEEESTSTEKTRTITIDHTKVAATLTDYPVMVKLTSGNFSFSEVRTDGYDIAFYDNSNNLLKFEREYFSKTDSIGVFHVKIPSISARAMLDNRTSSIMPLNPEAPV